MNEEFGKTFVFLEERRKPDMQALREAIARDGVGLGRDVVKVDMFLNHRIDTALLFAMGREMADRFRAEKPDVVLTVEASGIALAVAAAHALGDIPAVFAKKGATVLESQDMAQAKVYSFTHKRENVIRVEKRYLPAGSRVLIVDDFLADGQATLGMISLCEQTNCSVAGVAIAVEKGFMPGGRLLREKGYKVSSLAVVTGIENGKILLADD